MIDPEEKVITYTELTDILNETMELIKEMMKENHRTGGRGKKEVDAALAASGVILKLLHRKVSKRLERSKKFERDFDEILKRNAPSQNR